MISVINRDCELDVKSNTIEENRAEARVSGDSAHICNEEKAGVSEMELDTGAPKSEVNASVLENEGSDEVVKARITICEDSDVHQEMEEQSGVFEVKNEKNASFDQFDPQNNQFGGPDSEVEAKNDQMVHTVLRGDAHGEVYKSLLSEFEDFVANEKIGAMVGTSRALSYGFEVGDMVWGKVKSHPWWPGHIFSEAFASSSVRRTRREGYVLVAFFGDSSYGWFDPAELIPFDPHFSEKSQQTNSRNFVKAVEEALDEASRRKWLGLACRCRNRFNFRPTTVEGCYAVDLPDYEPGGIYPVSQIKKARDGFKPHETLAFVKQLALTPQGYDQNTIDYIKNKATAFAFRKAVFEEFDETYAQAFGAQAARPAHVTANILDQPIKEPTRAPLSGPLVIAEALGGEKKPVKVKDHLKKDRYLFKRRDEPSDSRTFPMDQRQASPSNKAAFMESSSAIAADDYVLHKRAPLPQISAKQEQTGFLSKRCADLSEVSGKAAVILDQATGCLAAVANQGTGLDAKGSIDKEKDALQETKVKTALDVDMNPMSMDCPDLPGSAVLPGVIDGASVAAHQEGEAMADVQNEVSGKVSWSNEDSQKIELRLPVRLEGVGGLNKLQHDHPSSHLSPRDAKRLVGISAVGGVKKAKVLKRPLGDSDKTIMGEKKKKKTKELGAETGPDRPKNQLAAGKGGTVVENSIGKPTNVGSIPREDPRVSHQNKGIGTGNDGALTMVGIGNVELELSQLLSDLCALALDPFHGAERNSPLVTMQLLLRFRALVYQKSLVLLPPSETEPVEVHASKSLSTVVSSDNSTGENERDFTPLKAVKSLVRPNDPTKSGRKRLLSDRQEEIAAKRLKKINQLKSLAAEKKAGLKALETKRAEGKEPVAAVPTKPVRPLSVKRVEPASTRTIDPTMLVMKFPPQTSLPSVAELKARFARFGSIDQSAIRVFWQTSTCRVVFRHKLDAQAAYKYAVGNNSLFGNVNVRYSLREVGAPAPEAPESDKGRGDNTTIEAPRMKDLVIERTAPVLAHQPLLQSTVQLKSILKKPGSDEAAQIAGGNGSRGTRVKFMLGGEETVTGRGEQLMVGNRNNFNINASFADDGAPTSVDMDFNSKNFQNVIPPPSSSPILSLPAQFAKSPPNNLHHAEVVAPRNLHNLNSALAASSVPIIDISQQMLSLLTRCNDVVTTVTGMLGYVPYHPL